MSNAYTIQALNDKVIDKWSPALQMLICEYPRHRRGLERGRNICLLNKTNAYFPIFERKMKTLKVIFISTLVLSTFFSELIAQQWTEIEIQSFAPDDLEGVYIVDWNNDGFNDIVTKDDVEPNYLFINPGNNKFSTRKAIGNREIVQVCDANNDSVPDIIYYSLSQFSDRINADLYDSLGNLTTTENLTAGLPYSFEGKQFLLNDFDQDGLNDLFVVRQNDTTNTDVFYIRYRDINGVFSDSVIYRGTNASGLGAKIKFSDFNYDGFLDIVIYYQNYNYQSSQIKLLLNDTLGFKPAITLLDIPMVAFGDQVSVDLNGDSLEDIAFAYPGVNDSIFWYSTDTAFNSTYEGLLAVNFEDVLDIQKFDANNNGLNDLLIGGRNIIYNNGSGYTTSNLVLENSSSFSWGFSRPIDFNKDGLVDVVDALVSTGQIFLREHLPNNSFEIKSLNTVTDIGNGTGSRQASTARVDSNDFKDFVVFDRYRNSLFYYLNQNGKGFSSRKTISDSIFDSYNSMIEVDLDADGISEYFLHSSFVSKALFIKRIGSSYVHQVLTDSSYYHVSRAKAIDLNQDGFQDIVYTLYSGEIYVIYGNSSANIGTPQLLANNPYGNIYDLTFLDYHNDGDLDIVYGSDSKLCLLFNNNGTFSPPPPFYIYYYFNVADAYDLLYSFDIDKDGDLDLFAASSTNAPSLLFVMENDTLPRQGISLTRFNPNRYNKVFFEDIDNDGLIDISYGNAWLKNNGNHNFTYSNSFNTSIPFITYVMDDLDLDGDYDIITGEHSYFPTSDRFAYFRNPTLSTYQLSGSVFYDANQNGLRENYEVGLPYHQVDVTGANNNFYHYTLPNGIYKVNADSVCYSLSYDVPNGWQLTTDSTYNVCLNDSNKVKQNLNFGLIPITLFDSVTLDIVSERIRCDNLFNQKITYQNIGTKISSGLISYSLDTAFQFIDSNPRPDSINTDSTVYWWSYNNLFYGEVNEITLDLIAPNASVTGNYFSFYADMSVRDSSLTETFTTTDTLTNLLFCAYDPNDKLSEPNYQFQRNHIPVNTDWIEYTIRFQNTGNDTAYQVLIIDTLSNDLLIESLEIISSSHSVGTSIDRTNRVINFLYENIYLPDSTTNFEASQGYIKFKVRNVNDFMVDSIILNTASIYFDSNPPIVTNIDTIVFGLTPFDQVFFKDSLCNISEASIETMIFTNSMGYDSVVTIEKIPLASDTTYLTTDLCFGNSYTLDNGTVLNAPGTYLDTILLINFNGCDSLVQHQITINPTFYEELRDTIQPSENYTLPSGLNVNETGTYNITLTTSESCDSLFVVNLFVDSTVGTNSIDFIGSRWWVYPNPATDHFTIEIVESNHPYQIEVLNIIGKQVEFVKYSRTINSISTKYWSPGVYYILLRDQDGRVLTSKKIILE